MRTEEAFRMLMDRIERLTIERNEAKNDQQRQHSELQRITRSMRAELDQYRHSLAEHRKALRGKKKPTPPLAFLEWQVSQRADADIPF